jgi:hypothetical protein
VWGNPANLSLCFWLFFVFDAWISGILAKKSKKSRKVESLLISQAEMCENLRGAHDKEIELYS